MPQEVLVDGNLCLYDHIYIVCISLKTIACSAILDEPIEIEKFEVSLEPRLSASGSM